MTMAEKDDILEAFFEAERASASRPSEALLARIETAAADALEARRPAPNRRRTGWRGALASFGGWRVGAGLASVALAGICIGVVLPDQIAEFAPLGSTDTLYELGELAPGYATDWLGDV